MEYDFEIKYKTRAKNRHVDALSRLLNGSPAVAHDLAEENDLNISSSKNTSDRSQLKHQNYDQADDFLEPEYEE